MKKLIIAIITLLIIYGIFFYESGKNISYKYKYEITTKGKTSKLSLTCLIPQDIAKVQKVKNINYSIKPDLVFYYDRNIYAQFIINKPSKTEEIVISVDLLLYNNDFEASIKNEIPLNEPIYDFLGSEKYIETDSEEIKLKALELKDSSIIQTVENIYSFVNQNIEYAGYNPIDVGALKALNSGKGDCTEFSDLFVALCRANNIPARVVEGYTTDYFNTPKHAWTEVYIKRYGWVKFDPTPGNLSTFKTMKRRYIQLSTVRNDKVLNNNHFCGYNYWGDPVEIKEYFENRLIK